MEYCPDEFPTTCGWDEAVQEEYMWEGDDAWDADSALASSGFGTDEDYGFYGDCD